MYRKNRKARLNADKYTVNNDVIIDIRNLRLKRIGTLYNKIFFLR